MVVVLRSTPRPSAEALQAALLARDTGKPVHALVLRGMAADIDVDESHMIALDLTWESEKELHAWAAGLAERFGRPT